MPAFDGSTRIRNTSIHALLNDDQCQSSSTTSNATATKVHSPGDAHAPTSTTDKDKSALAIDHSLVTRIHDDISSRTTGCSIEQLEQVNSVLMDTVWRMRHEWNRGVVAVKVAEAFNHLLEDMEECGWEFGPSSWGRQAD